MPADRRCWFSTLCVVIAFHLLLLLLLYLIEWIMTTKSIFVFHYIMYTCILYVYSILFCIRQRLIFDWWSEVELDWCTHTVSIFHAEHKRCALCAPLMCPNKICMNKREQTPNNNNSTFTHNSIQSFDSIGLIVWIINKYDAWLGSQPIVQRSTYGTKWSSFLSSLFVKKHSQNQKHNANSIHFNQIRTRPHHQCLMINGHILPHTHMCI